MPRRIAAARAVRDARRAGRRRGRTRRRGLDKQRARVAPAGAGIEAGGGHRLEPPRELDAVARFEDAKPARVVTGCLGEHDAIDAADAHVRTRPKALAVGVRDQRAPQLHRAARLAMAVATVADCNPSSARCMTAAPSRRSATTATARRVVPPTSHVPAAATPPATSASPAGAAPRCSPKRMPATVAPSPSSGPKAARAVTT